MAHRAEGGRVLLATHAPIAIEDGIGLVLDDFAARLDPTLAGQG